ncbi:MAG: ABC transporter permease subunit, partial [Chloroflexota bacterium]
MTNVAGTTPVPGQTQRPPRSSIGSVLAQTEIDLRLFGMLLALIVILVTFHILSGGKLIAPTNMVTMAIQATGIAIIATGMVLVIVSRNIDLSVGSLAGLIAMIYALLMTDWLTAIGIGADFPFRWVLALAIGIGLGALVGGLQGFIIAYIGVPSFVVTLGGLLSIRGVIYYLSNGAAVSGLDPGFQKIGGGGEGSIGGPLTWALGIIGCVAIVGLLINNRRQRRSYGFPLRPMWAEVLLA